MPTSPNTAASPVSQAAISSDRPLVFGSRRRSFFCVGISGLLLLIVVAGFSRTLYFRALFEAPQIPLYLYLHGAILTAWFAGLVLQTALVKTGRPDLHRRFGPFGVGTAVAVFLISLFAVFSFPARQQLQGIDVEAGIARISRIVWIDLVALVAFATFVGAAIVLRHRRESHKRFMLLASISIVQPALARLFRLPAFSGIVPDRFVSLATLVALILSIAVHDLITLRRIHPATLIGGSLFLGLWTIAGHLFPSLDFAKALVRWLT
jgi:hypothetical protein